MEGTDVDGYQEMLDEIGITLERSEELKDMTSKLFEDKEGDVITTAELVKRVATISDDKLEVAYVMNRLTSVLMMDNYGIES